jgi:plasmid stabilization system protein ParE
MGKRRPNFEFHKDAASEARDAAEWYAQQSARAASRFKEELRRAESSVTKHPQSWSPYLHGTRYFKLDRFPYALVYVERADRIVGIAVAHLKRRPGYWRKRLAD